MQTEIYKTLQKLFAEYFGSQCSGIESIPMSGSNRKYFRLRDEKNTAIGTFTPDINEYNASTYFTGYFVSKGFNVPKILIENKENHIYLQEDLGSSTLFDAVIKDKSEGIFSNSLLKYYKEALNQLIAFQLSAKGIDFSKAYPVSSFDRQAMQWDLNYFKYYFLKFFNISFDEYKLEQDFARLLDFLAQADSSYFMYRDFQARNIHIRDQKLYFIDFQGGRKGPLAYDLASILFQVKADIPFDKRLELSDYYINALAQKIQFNKEEFKQYYWGFVLIRLLQVMGAYGFRGLHEKKAHFLSSIPYVQKNIHWVKTHIQLHFKTDYLFKLLDILNTQIGELPSLLKTDKLHVQINSFSYKYGVPNDYSGNGGGYVFDCRALPNPGRYNEYKTLTGRDKEVISFLENQSEVDFFKQHAFAIINQAVNNYIERGFTSLMINFGCTGGQHRSVYMAEQMNRYLKEKFEIEINLNHRELK